MKVSAIEFVNCYLKTLDEIGITLRDAYQPTLARMRDIDPHDLVALDQEFASANHVYGFIYRILMSNHKDA